MYIRIFIISLVWRYLKIPGQMSPILKAMLGWGLRKNGRQREKLLSGRDKDKLDVKRRTNISCIVCKEFANICNSVK